MKQTIFRKLFVQH